MNTPLDRSQNQVNPKLGLSWQAAEQTTVRGAVFRTLKRSLVANQTLEPTQVAGFNQFFDDIEASDVWTYAAAIDQKFSSTLYGGIWGMHRDLQVPVIYADTATGTTSNVQWDWHDEIVRPYLFWTPTRNLALSAEYQYEHFERTNDNQTIGFEHVTTQKVPLGARYFLPNGLTFGIKGTYYDQSGNFKPKTGNCCVEGSDNFWLFDAGIAYRLPQRHGFVTLTAVNVFDRKFNFQETDFSNPTIVPTRSIFARISLSLP